MSVTSSGREHPLDWRTENRAQRGYRFSKTWRAICETAFVTSWQGLHQSFRHTLELAWDSASAGSLGIGAVITLGDTTVVSTGRNRLFESDAGEDTLAGTSLAHAELNALAKLPVSKYRDEHLVLWTTLQPCIQCLGAIRLSNVSHVNILAPDPLFRGIENIRDVNPFLARNWPIIEERVVDEFAVLALLLPTHTSAFWESWPPGWRESLPKLSNLAANLAASERLIEAAKLRVPIESVFTDLYPQLTACLDEVQKLSAS